MRQRPLGEFLIYRPRVISGFLFDLDGTLVDSERQSGEAMARALLAGQGIEVTQVLPLISEHAVFDVIVASEDVARSKPAPDGYLSAIRQLGVAAHDCLVLEDSVAGIAAGRAAGCLVLAIRAGNFGGWDQTG